MIAPPSARVIYERLEGGHTMVRYLFRLAAGGVRGEDFEYDPDGKLVLSASREAAPLRTTPPEPEAWEMFRRLELLTERAPYGRDKNAQVRDGSLDERDGTNGHELPGRRAARSYVYSPTYCDGCWYGRWEDREGWHRGGGRPWSGSIMKATTRARAVVARVTGMTDTGARG